MRGGLYISEAGGGGCGLPEFEELGNASLKLIVSTVKYMLYKNTQGVKKVRPSLVGSTSLCIYVFLVHVSKSCDIR